MTSTAEPPTTGSRFLDERVARGGARAAARATSSPDDALRGLYISDEQALALAADADGHRRRRRGWRMAAERCASTRSTPPCSPSAPRRSCIRASAACSPTCRTTSRARLPSPRLAADLLAGDGSSPRDVLGCFAPGARLALCGALRLVRHRAPCRWPSAPPSSPTGSPASCSAPPPLAEAGAPAPLRRVAPPADASGRARRTVAAHRRPARRPGSGLPIVVVGPTPRRWSPRPPRRRWSLLDVRDLERPPT